MLSEAESYCVAERCFATVDEFLERRREGRVDGQIFREPGGFYPVSDCYCKPKIVCAVWVPASQRRSVVGGPVSQTSDKAVDAGCVGGVEWNVQTAVLVNDTTHLGDSIVPVVSGNQKDWKYV